MSKPEFTLQDFVDSGLLFEVNRMVLHPLGLAMSVSVDSDTGEVLGFGGFIDSRDDQEGFIFGDELFADGWAKIERYMAERGTAAIESRYESLGFIIQEPDDE